MAKPRKIPRGFPALYLALSHSYKRMHHFSEQKKTKAEPVVGRRQVCISGRNAGRRKLFNMKYFEDLKYDEISEIVGTSVGALKASYHLAVKKIEHFFATHD